MNNTEKELLQLVEPLGKYLRAMNTWEARIPQMSNPDEQSAERSLFERLEKNMRVRLENR